MKKTKRLLAAILSVVMAFSINIGSISAAEETDADTTTEPVTQTIGKTFTIGEKTVNVGDYFQMGTYYDEPILWRCIALDENGPLMLSDKILCIKPFDVAGENTSGSHGRGHVYNNTAGYYRQQYGSNYWGDSNIRDWLNSDASAGNVVWSCGNPPDKDHVYNGYNVYDQEAGFLNGFSEDERSAILTVTQKQLLDGYEYSSSRNENYHRWDSGIYDVLQNYDTAYSETTTDKVFLLDVKQVYDLYNDFGDYYKAYCTSKAVDNSDYPSYISTNSYGYYWLRSPEANGYFSSGVRCVIPSGNVKDCSAYYYDCVGVRPAFYLNLKSVILSGGSGSETDPYVLNGEPTNDVIEISAIGGKAYLNPVTGIITGCDSTVTEITIPEEIDSVKIEGIAPAAFTGCTELKVVKCAKGSPADDAKLYPETAQIIYTNAAEFVFGDADGDNIVTASDAAMVLQKTLVSTFELPMEKETDNWMKYVDVDADTFITASDAAFILQKTLVSTFELPAEKK